MKEGCGKKRSRIKSWCFYSPPITLVEKSMKTKVTKSVFFCIHICQYLLDNSTHSGALCKILLQTMIKCDHVILVNANLYSANKEKNHCI